MDFNIQVEGVVEEPVLNIK